MIFPPFEPFSRIQMSNWCKIRAHQKVAALQHFYQRDSYGHGRVKVTNVILQKTLVTKSYFTKALNEGKKYYR